MSRQPLILVGAVILVLIGCRPAAGPAAVPAVVPQSVPTASSTVPPSTLANPTAAPAASNSTLTIIATTGPTCPGPTRPGQDCTKPYQGDFVVLRPDGSEAAQVSTNADGRVVVNLPPGNYTVSIKLQPGTELPRANTVDVSVGAGQAAEVTIELDTGMR